MMRRLLPIPALLALLAAGAARADDIDALNLADTAPSKVERASDWHMFVEGALGQYTLRGGNLTGSNQRLSFDVQFDKSFAPGWRAVFADRLDMNWQSEPERQNGINTLKEAYLSWQVQEHQILDLGRINARYGVATGYNPTDFFRDGAVRSVVSVDPGSLKKNRLGSVMLRGQTLWNGGSLTALYSPKLAQQPSDAALSPDFGATNNQQRWLLAASQQLTENINPQWLIYGEDRQPPQFGFNLTALANDATVAYVEWAGGRSRSLLSNALNIKDGAVFRNRLATGLTYTMSNKLSLTLEYEYNGAGLDKEAWQALPRDSPAAYGLYRKSLQSVQDLPTKQSVFLYAGWQDAMISHLDLNGMLRLNMADHSRLSWLEARYHWDKADLALQWQLNSGSLGSEFGSTPQQRAWQILLRYFF
jgi:hypothetical protein